MFTDDQPPIGGESIDADVNDLRRVLQPLQGTVELHPDYLDALTRDWVAQRQRRRSRLLVAVVGVLAGMTLVWHVQAQRAQVHVTGTAFIDDVTVWDGDRVLIDESWESRATAAPKDSTGGSPPFVTNAIAAQGTKSLLVTAMPRENPKARWPLTAHDVVTRILSYEASVYLDHVGTAGVIVGLVQDAEPSTDYDQAAVVFSHGRCRTWPVERALGSYEAKRWYRVRVEIRIAERMMDVWIDDVPRAQDVPYAAVNGAISEHPDWSTERLWEGFDHFAVGGVYDGSVLEEAGKPLEVAATEPGHWAVRVDGSVCGWRPTGIRLHPGDRLHITADPDQEIRYAGRAAAARTNPDGCLLQADDPCAVRYIQDTRFPVPASNAWFGSLVARTGSSEGFFAGSDIKFAVLAEGELFLAYNDNTVTDNSGFFDVAVSVTAAGTLQTK